jgi:cysteine desulfurase/selenocysteine lyase
MMQHLGDARREAAALIGADEDEIALVESTQHGLNVAAQVLELCEGDNVVCSEMDFVGTVLPWWNLRAHGIELRLVPARDGAVEADELAAACDARTRAVAVSSVQEVNGWRIDLAGLSERCRARGIALVVDAAQHVGPLRFDVRETPVDFLAVGGHKWLCSQFGLGFLYSRRELVERYQPRLRGYMSMREPEQGWESCVCAPARPVAVAF